MKTKKKKKPAIRQLRLPSKRERLAIERRALPWRLSEVAKRVAAGKEALLAIDRLCNKLHEDFSVIDGHWGMIHATTGARNGKMKGGKR